MTAGPLERPWKTMPLADVLRLPSNHQILRPNASEVNRTRRTKAASYCQDLWIKIF